MPKPACYGEQYASAFQEYSVGCGTGFLARHMVSIANAVDALDVSEAMIAQGKALPNGDHPRLRWMLGRAVVWSALSWWRYA